MAKQLDIAINQAVKVMLATFVLLLVIVLAVSVYLYGRHGITAAVITGVVAALVMLVTFISMRLVSRRIEYAQAILMGAFMVKIAIIFISIMLVMQLRSYTDGRIVFIGLAIFIAVLAIVESVTLGRARQSTIDDAQ